MQYFKNIRFVNFRNFNKNSYEFSKSCNVLYGQNGSGKTNILEGISLFSKGRGIRKDKLSNIVKKKYDKFIIKSDFNNDEIIYNLTLETQIQKNKIRKILSVNNDISKESTDIINEFISFLYFLPENERLFISSPSNRRNFIDRLIFSYKNLYNKKINEYNKFLQERSKLLTQNIFDESWLIQLEKKISSYGLDIYLIREAQINILKKNLNIYLKKFNLPFNINVELDDKFYNNNIDHEFYIQQLKNNRKIDSLIGGSKIGPHKSDYIFYINDNFEVSQLSTGQQKTLILLIYLSQCEYLVTIKKKQPILLLDEVCSHLDDVNRKILLTLLESFKLQVFMTGTTKNLFSFLSTNTNFCNIES